MVIDPDTRALVAAQLTAAVIAERTWPGGDGPSKIAAVKLFGEIEALLQPGALAKHRRSP
jgi:hypothetical protein